MNNTPPPNEYVHGTFDPPLPPCTFLYKQYLTPPPPFEAYVLYGWSLIMFWMPRVIEKVKKMAEMSLASFPLFCSFLTYRFFRVQI